MPPRRASRIALLTGIALFLWTAFHLLPHRRGRFVPSAVDWSHFEHHHPPSAIKPLPTGQARRQRRVQADPSVFESLPEQARRRDAVRKAFKRSYDAYREYAWMHDELRPLSGGTRDPFGGWAATLVDSLDTLWIMGFESEFREAASAAATIDWMKTEAGAANLFETTIRHLGGLLSAYDLSGDEALRKKAVELGEMLYVGFDTPNRMPGFWLNWADARRGGQLAGTNDASAAPGSLCLEFTRLSQITGDPKFYDATDRITRFLESIQNDTALPGMWPTQLDFRRQIARDNSFTLGALADSLYEYLPKMHLVLGGLDDTYEKMYRTAMDTAIEHLLFRPMLPNKENILFTGDLRVHGEGISEDDIELIPESQHLTCFVGGMFGLGGTLFDIPEHVDIGERLARGCGWAYSSFPTGVMPEIFNLFPCPDLNACPWDDQRWQDHAKSKMPKGFKNARDPRYQLRPEAIESIFIMYRITGKTELQDMAWDMFNSIMKATATELANAAIVDVTVEGFTDKKDSMESFWMAETLKYFYLIFSPPDVISLDEYVLNTEAHPLRRPDAETG